MGLELRQLSIGPHGPSKLLGLSFEPVVHFQGNLGFWVHSQEDFGLFFHLVPILSHHWAFVAGRSNRVSIVFYLDF